MRADRLLSQNATPEEGRELRLDFGDGCDSESADVSTPRSVTTSSAQLHVMQPYLIAFSTEVEQS